MMLSHTDSQFIRYTHEEEAACEAGRKGACEQMMCTRNACASILPPGCLLLNRGRRGESVEVNQLQPHCSCTNGLYLHSFALAIAQLQ